MVDNSMWFTKPSRQPKNTLEELREATDSLIEVIGYIRDGLVQKGFPIEMAERVCERLLYVMLGVG